MAIEKSAPHIYLSVLPFTAKRSLIHKNFAHLYTGLISINKLGSDRQNNQLIMTLTAPEDDFYSLAYSHDSRLLASGSRKGIIRIWDTHIGEEVREPLRSINGPIKCVAFAPNGSSLAYSSYSQTGVVYVWSLLADREAPAQLFGHSDVVRSVVFSPDGFLIASASDDESVRIWRSDTGRNTALILHTSKVNAVAYSPDGQFLASYEDKTTRLWHGTSGEPVRVYHREWIYSISFLPDGTKLAIGGVANIELWDHQSGNIIASLKAHGTFIGPIYFSPGGDFMVTVGLDGTTRVREMRHLNSKDAVATILHYDRGNVFSPGPVILSPDGMYIACASDRAIRILGVDGSRAVDQLQQARDAVVTSVAVSLDLNFIVSGSSDSAVRVWNAQTGKLKLPPLLGHRDGVLSVAISPEGRLIASASSDRSVRLWNSQTGNAFYQPLDHDEEVRVVTFSPDGQFLAFGSVDGSVRIWHVLTCQTSSVITLSSGKSVDTVKFSPDSHTIAVGTSDGELQFWRADTTRWIWNVSPADISILNPGSSTVHSVAFLPDGPRIASAYRHGIHVLDVSTCKIVLNLKLPDFDNCVTSVGFSHDGRYIVCASFTAKIRFMLLRELNPGAIHLWDATTGSLVATLYGHEAAVNFIAFTSDGRSIVSCCSNTIRVWDLAAVLLLSQKNPCNPIRKLSSTEHEDEWLRGPSGELLLWVPEEYRGCIQASPCTLLIGKRRVVIEGDGQGLRAGENWTACWRGDVINPLPRALQ